MPSMLHSVFSLQRARVAAFVAVSLLLTLVVPSLAADGQIRETVLPNGLKVITKEVHASPVVAFNIWYRVGSRNEQLGKTGMSHLLEHMQFKGTKTLKKGEIDRLIETNGGIQNAATWKDFTYYWEVLSSDKLDLAMRIEADRMVNSLIDPKEFNAEKVVVLSEQEGNDNEPDRLMDYELYSTAFKAHPYQWPTIGWRHDLESITRDELYRYYRTYYQPNNATIVIVGDFDTEKALALVRKYFGSIPRGPQIPKLTAQEPEQLGERRAVIRKQGAAERILIGYHIPAVGHPDIYALDVLEIILGRGTSSRLYRALIDTQLATDAWAYSGTSGSPDLFRLGATARDGVKIRDVEKALLAEVERVKNEQVTDDELQKALNQLEASFIYEKDSVTDQAETIGYFETIHSWRFIETYLDKARRVTKADVQRVARKYLTERNRTVVTFIPEEPVTSARHSTPTAQPERRYYAAYKSYDVAPRVASPSMPKSTVVSTSGSRIKPTRVTLSNGITIIVHENRSNPTISVQGSLNAGAMLEPEGKNGLAALTAALLQKGTATRSADDIARQKDFTAISLNTGADTESASFSGRTLSKNFDLFLDLLSDVLRNPTFPQAEFDKAKMRMFSGIKQQQDDPTSLAFRAFYGSIYPKGHPYHRLSVEESLAEVSSITRDDVLAFYGQHYAPQSMVIVIVGDVDTGAAIEKIRRYFGDWKPTDAPAKRPEIPTVPLPSGISKKVIYMPDKAQVDVVFGYPGGLKRSDPDFYTVTIMNYILGGGGALSSRMGDIIRDEMGLVYSVYSVFDAGLGAGPFYTYLGTNPKNVDKAIKTALDQIVTMKEKGATQAEVKDAIDFITGSFPARRLVDNSSIAQTLHSAEIYGLGMDYIEKYSSLYRAVTLEKVNAAAKKYLHPDRYSLVIAGPYKGQ